MHQTNVQWIENVESNFHNHVAETFCKLEEDVERLRTLTSSTRTFGPAQRPAQDGPAQSPEFPEVPPGISTSCSDGTCRLVNTHCHHVEALLKDVHDLRARVASNTVGL